VYQWCLEVEEEEEGRHHTSPIPPISHHHPYHHHYYYHHSSLLLLLTFHKPKMPPCSGLHVHDMLIILHVLEGEDIPHRITEGRIISGLEDQERDADIGWRRGVVKSKCLTMRLDRHMPP